MDQEFNKKESFTWERVKDRCIAKFKTIWVSDLIFRQKVDTQNSIIIPTLTYVTSNIIKGDALDVKLRTILVAEKACYKAAARSRLYMSTDKGGCGLKSIKDAMEESTIYTWAYLCTRADFKLSYNLLGKMTNRGKRSIISDAARVLKDYNIYVEMEVTTPAVILGGVRYVEATKLARQVAELIFSIRIYLENQAIKNPVISSVQPQSVIANSRYVKIISI